LAIISSTLSKVSHKTSGYPEVQSTTTRAARPNDNRDGWSTTLCEKWLASADVSGRGDSYVFLDTDIVDLCNELIALDISSFLVKKLLSLNKIVLTSKFAPV